MDKITIIPGSVRGYGDIVSPKSLEDFLLYDAELSFEDSLYTLAYDSSGISVGLTVSSGTISVGSSVTLTAEVLSEGEPASGETVSFYDGSTLLGTDTTDSSGEATYTTSSLSVGTHSLTAVALGKSSLAVSVTVNKLTSTITISVPATGTVGTSYTVTGTLVPTTGSVKLYENGVLKDTLTVSSGSFSKAITQSNEGTYTYYAVFEGSSTYSGVTSSTGSIVVSDVPPVPVVTSVSLTSDKSVLSYYDSESATLSATVLDQSSQPMSGVTVEFFKGGTSIGTADTNSSGVATKSYASAGVGDVSFTASVGTIVSETYVIEDCAAYVTSFSDWSSVTNKNTAYKFSPFTLPTNHQIEFKLTGSSGIRLACGDTTHTNATGYLEWIYAWYVDSKKLYYRTSTNSETNQSLSYTINNSTIFKLTYEGTSLKLYAGATQLKSVTSYDTLTLTRLMRLNNDTISNIDWIKVKPL